MNEWFTRPPAPPAPQPAPSPIGPRRSSNWKPAAAGFAAAVLLGAGVFGLARLTGRGGAAAAEPVATPAPVTTEAPAEVSAQAGGIEQSLSDLADCLGVSDLFSQLPIGDLLGHLGDMGDMGGPAGPMPGPGMFGADGTTVTVTGPDGVTVYTLDGDGSVTITKSGDSVTVTTDGAATQSAQFSFDLSQLGDLWDGSVPPVSLPDLSQLDLGELGKLDLNTITACLSDLGGGLG